MRYYSIKLLVIVLASITATHATLRAMHSKPIYPNQYVSPFDAALEIARIASSKTPEELVESIQKLNNLYDIATCIKLLKHNLSQNDAFLLYDLRNKDKESALHCCARSPGLLDCAKIILGSTLTPELTWKLLSSKDVWKAIPFHWAIRNGYIDLVNEFIQTAAHLGRTARLIFMTDMWGETALHIAAFHERVDIVEILIATSDKYAVAELLADKKNKLGQTAQNLLQDCQCKGIINILKEYTNVVQIWQLQRSKTTAKNPISASW